MHVIMMYSESGGVSKTTTAVSVAMCAAERGMTTVLIDLDPRAAATKWVGVEPVEPGLHVGAILAAEDPTGWADDLAVPTTWHPNLAMIPSARAVSNREADRADHAELRLATSLTGLSADLVVIDCPNRQGGVLTLSALNAATAVVYAATPTQDGVDGVEGARQTVVRFMQSRRAIGAPVALTEAGIVLGALAETIISRPARMAIDDLRATELLLTPLIPHRAIVPECRTAGQWYGTYTKGAPVAEAYQNITAQLTEEGR